MFKSELRFIKRIDFERFIYYDIRFNYRLHISKPFKLNSYLLLSLKAAMC